MTVEIYDSKSKSYKKLPKDSSIQKTFDRMEREMDMEDKAKMRLKEKEKKNRKSRLEKIGKKISSILKKKPTSRSIIKKSSQGTVDVSQPVYTEDKPRYYKQFVKENRRQLFFK